MFIHDTSSSFRLYNNKSNAEFRGNLFLDKRCVIFCAVKMGKIRKREIFHMCDYIKMDQDTWRLEDGFVRFFLLIGRVRGHLTRFILEWMIITTADWQNVFRIQNHCLFQMVK